MIFLERETGLELRGIKLGKLALYQLSYSRLLNIIIKELEKRNQEAFTGAAPTFNGWSRPLCYFIPSCIRRRTEAATRRQRR